MRKFANLIIISSVMSIFANAEIYRNISPFDSVADVKAKFPNANFEKLNPAWAKKSDIMYQITGEGIDGAIVVKFFDIRPYALEQSELEENIKLKEWYISMIDQPDDTAITVSWVRWVPSSPIPIRRLISKFGPPEKSSFTSDEFRPYRSWEKRGITAVLSNDENYVIYVDYEITKSDLKKANNKKYNFVPKPHK